MPLSQAEPDGGKGGHETALPPVVSSAHVVRWSNGQAIQLDDRVAEEAPISLVYNGQPHVVMLATPQDLEEFAIGFSLSEEIVKQADEITGIEIQAYPEGVEVNVTIPFERFAALAGKERNLAGRTGCGLCGARSLAQAVRHPAPVAQGIKIASSALHRALEELLTHQTLNSLTGAVHAAGWAECSGRITWVREDVGRHNALDKIIGALARSRTDPASGFIVVTSRASYEMVQKAATVGVTLLAAVSAPTGLAIRLAEETRITLVGFARPNNHVIYANAQRIEGNEGIV